MHRQILVSDTIVGAVVCGLLQADAVAKSMSKVMDKMNERDSLLGELDNKTTLLKGSSQGLYKNMKKAKQAVCCRYLKWVLLVVGLVTVILAVIGVVVWVKYFKDK